ncbi:hypothetical protein IWX90DRAFT_412807 [Phyllosticta citrichinensis]|uniref:Zn(2)-C6 fungal-type domain-containing protein n=1 Tax=Phyllosticta citrichinensis TaxID=1130410 RepID=A0ABR1XYY4_9PEZI
MSRPMKPPDDPRAAPSQSPGFWSQNHLHMRPQQERPLYPRIIHGHENIQQERPLYPSLIHGHQDTQQERSQYRSTYSHESIREQPIYQQQPRITEPEATSPAPLLPQLYGEPYIHPSRIYGRRADPPEFLSSSEYFTEGSRTLRNTQPYISQYSGLPDAAREQTGRVGAYYRQNYPRMDSETKPSGQRETLPYAEPYPQPVRSIESDHVSPATLTRSTSDTTWSEKKLNLHEDDATQPEAVITPDLPYVDICDERLPVDVRMNAWRKFKSAMDKGKNKWVNNGCPPCPNNHCRAIHPPPCRTMKALKKFTRTLEAGRWLEARQGKSPCLKCRQIHKGHCVAPQCNECEGYRKEKFSCETSRKRVKAAEEIHRNLGQLQLQKYEKQLQHPLPRKPTPDDQDFVASAFRGIMEARLSGISSEEEKNRITRNFLGEFAQSLQSKRKRDEDGGGNPASKLIKYE